MLNKTDRAILLSASVLSVTIGSIPAAYAYIDPSVVTITGYSITAIVGVVISACAVGAIWWRKTRKKVAKKLNIDENRNKEKEAELEETDDDDE